MRPTAARSNGRRPSPRSAPTISTFATASREDEFVEDARGARQDARLPKLIIPSIQVNIRGGNLPEPDESGKRHLKVPLNQL